MDKKNKVEIFILNIYVLFLGLLLPTFLSAEIEKPFITYEGSIIADENGDPLLTPFFVVSDSKTGEIYVIDGKLRIIIYTSDFFPIHTLSKKNAIEAPQALAVDAEGNIYIAQGASKSNSRSRITVLDACFKWVRDIYFDGFEGSDSFVPYNIAVDKNGNLYVAGYYFPGVLILDTKGKLLDIMTVEREGEKVKLINVYIDKMGRIFLLSEEMSRIYVFDEKKKFLFEFGEKGGSTGKLSRPRALAIDSNLRMYVVDYMRHSISIYDKDGIFINEFGGMGWTEGWFQFPTFISIDTNSRLLVSDTFNNRVQVFKTK